MHLNNIEVINYKNLKRRDNNEKDTVYQKQTRRSRS